MAIRYRKESKAYQVYWNNPFTHRRECKTFHSKSEANEYNSQIVHKLKFDRASFRPCSRYSKDMTLNELWNLYISEKSFTEKNSSVYKYKMKRNLEILGKAKLSDITIDELTEIREYYTHDKSLPKSVAFDRLHWLRIVINFAISKGIIRYIKFPTLSQSRYEKFIPPNQDEIERIFKHGNDNIRRVIVLGAYFGVRVGPSELFQLTWDDVDLTKKVLRIHGSIKNPNAPWREVPIRDDLIPLFLKWREIDQDKPVNYLISFRGKPIKAMNCTWRRTLKKAGINRRIRPYDLRHAFGTELVANGVDIGTVASLMGHSDPTMLLTHYQYVLDKQKQQAVSKLPMCHFMCQ